MTAGPVTLLDGATTPPPPNRWPGTPGEFAAAWNAANLARRAELVESMQRWASDSERCFVANHVRELERMRAQLRALETREAELLAAMRAMRAQLAVFDGLGVDR